MAQFVPMHDCPADQNAPPARDESAWPSRRGELRPIYALFSTLMRIRRPDGVALLVGAAIAALHACAAALASAQPLDIGIDGGVEDSSEVPIAGSSAPAPPASDDLEIDEAQMLGATARVRRPPPGAVSRVELRGPELTQIPGTFGEPLRVPATLPGVAHSPFGVGFFLVRGASFQNTGFMVDGFQVPLLYHLGAGPAILSSRLVDQLDFYPGGYPVSMGRFTGGVIALRTKPPPTDRLQLELEVDALRASALAIIPLPDARGSVAVAIRRSYFELLLPLITDDVELSYTDYQLRLDYQVTDEIDLALLFFGSRDSLHTRGLEPGPTEGSTGVDYAFDQLLLSATWRPSDVFRLRTALAFGPSTIDLGRDQAGDASLGTQTAAVRLGGRVEAVYTPAHALQSTLGVEYSLFSYDVKASVPSFGEFPGIPSPGLPSGVIEVADELLERAYAIYGEQVVRVGRFEFSAGLRAEQLNYGDVSRWELDPRGVIRFALTDDARLKVGSGLFAQPPLPFQLTRGVANPRLLPTRSLQNSLGAEIALPLSMEIDTSVFYSRMWRLARGSSRPVAGPDGEPMRPLLLDDGEGRSYGYELLLRRRAERGVFGWLSYTLSRSERFLEGGRKVVFAFDQTHVLNFAISYAWRGFTFGARMTLASGRPVGDVLDREGDDAVYDADQDDFDPDSGGRRTRLPLYHQLDVRIDRDWTLGPIVGSVYLDIINVYNAQNSEGYRYEYDFSQRDRLPGLPFLPTLGVRGVLR
jgi:hypothetical protein